MKGTRRRLLAGLGGLVLGGATLLSSGAFTSVEAERGVEVNVLVDGAIGDSDQFADVLVDAGGFETVAVRADGELNTTGGGLFPTEGESYDNPEFGERYVSLLQNDVTIVFGFNEDGEDRRLQPDTTTTYADLIALVNTNDEETEGAHTLAFDNSGFSGGTEVEFENVPEPEDVVVGANAAEEYGVNVVSAGESDTGGVLRITIEPADEGETPPPGEATFDAEDTTDDELFEFTVDPDDAVSGVDPVELEFDDPVADGLTSEDVTLRNLTEETPGNRRRLLIRQYSGSTAPVEVSGTITVEEESVVVDGTAGGVDDPDSGTLTPDQVTLVRDGDDEIVSEGLDAESVESQRLRVTEFSPEEEFDLDGIALEYPDGTEFHGTDNGDFNLTRRATGGDRQAMRVNNDTYEGAGVTLDVDGSPSNNRTFNPEEEYTIEIAVDLSRAELEAGEVTLELKNADGDTVAEFTDTFDR